MLQYAHQALYQRMKSEPAMRFLTLSLLVLQLILLGKKFHSRYDNFFQGSHSEVEDLQEILQEGCLARMPQPALKKTVEENERKIDRSHELLKDIFEILGKLSKNNFKIRHSIVLDYCDVFWRQSKDVFIIN